MMKIKYICTITSVLWITSTKKHELRDEEH